MRSNLGLSYIFIFLCFHCSLEAKPELPPLPRVNLFTIENGLSQTRVNVNFVDSQGYLWIGTSDGLNRYDGYGFEVFRHRPFDSTSISNNYIRSLDEDDKGHVWVGTNSGLNSFDPNTGEFTHYADLWKDSMGLVNEISSVHCGNNGQVWILNEHFLSRIQTENFEIEKYYFPSSELSGAAIDVNSDIVRDRNDVLWFGTNAGLFSFNPKTEKFRLYYPGSSEPDAYAEVIHSVYEDTNGELWIGGTQGLYKFDRLNKEFKHFSRDENKGEKGEIRSITQDKYGNLWLIGSNALFLFDKKNETIQSYEELIVEGIRRPVGHLNSIVCDGSNILWIGGLQGLMKLDLKPRKFKLYNSSRNSTPQLTNENISAVLKEDDSYLWVGYWRNGVDRIDLKTGRLVHYDSDNGLRSNRIRAIFQDSRERIWMGTAEGINIVTPEGNIIGLEEKIPFESEDFLKNLRVYSFVEDERGNIWLGSDKGLLRINYDEREVEWHGSKSQTDNDIPVHRIHVVEIDDVGNLWLGTDKGLVRYNPGEDFFERIEMKKGYLWLGMSPVYSLYAGSDNKIWIGTSYGLSSYDYNTGDFKHYSEENGLANSFVYAIQQDKNSNIWLSTNKGLSKFNPLRNSFRNYGKDEGLQAYEFNKGASYYSPDGELFFGGVSGLNSFYPEEIYDNPFIPQVLITGIEVIDETGINKITIGKETSRIKIRFNQSFIIHFSALDFTYPHHNLFKYSLQELDKSDKWLNLGKNHKLTISNLASGEYVFKVMGSNNDGVWSTEPEQLRILVQAPFWKTRAAYISYFLLVVLVFYLVIQNRTMALRRTSRKLKEKENTSREISKQKELLSRRNKNIEDSLKYAQRIQSAMLNTPRLFKKYLPDSFILHKPKDIVSGDFYWISEMKGKVFVAAVDCTGHGVPGAFMSVIGFELFRKIINMENIEDPGEILNKLNKNFEEIFGVESGFSLRDGMDLAFCVFEKDQNYLKYAGAFNPMYIVRDNKLTEIKGDRMSIGADHDPRVKHKVEKKFTTHIVELEKDDMIYLFSDGYADQFGGPEGKKFKYRRFRHLLLTIHKLPLEKQKQFLENSIEEWRGMIDQIDDILVIGIKAGKSKSPSIS